MDITSIINTAELQLQTAELMLKQATPEQRSLIRSYKFKISGLKKLINLLKSVQNDRSLTDEGNVVSAFLTLMMD